MARGWEIARHRIMIEGVAEWLFEGELFDRSGP
jgi:hypothetical protein